MTAKRAAKKKPRQQSARAKAAGVAPSLPPTTPAVDTAEKVARVIARIETGELVKASCEAESMSINRLLEWRDLSDANRNRYARARESQAHCIADEAMTIVDGPNADVVFDDKTGAFRIVGEVVQRAKLRAEQRRWYVAKVAPRQYGDKLDLTSDGKPLNADTVAKMTAAELRAEIAKRIAS